MFVSIDSYAQYDSISFDGINRSFLLHLPSGYDGASDIPLVIAMHGGFGNAYSLQYQSQLSVKADAENFIVVYPEGLAGGILGISSWNAGWCCGWASNNDIDDKPKRKDCDKHASASINLLPLLLLLYSCRAAHRSHISRNRSWWCVRCNKR